MNKLFKHDIAISFASADRNIALCIYLALKLKTPKASAYYYPENQGEMLGIRVKDKLQDIFRHDAKYVVLIVSKNYIDKNNEFVQAEIEAFMPRFHMEKATYLIPIIVDNTLIEEVHKDLKGLITIEWNYNPEEIIVHIQDYLEGTYTDGDKSSNDSEEFKNPNANSISFHKSPVVFGNGSIINY